MLIGLAACGGGVQRSAIPARIGWGDVDAAVRVAASGLDIAVLRVVEESERVRVYELTTIRDEPGRLRVEWHGEALEEVDVRMAEMTCRLTRFGDPARERAFVETVRSWRATQSR